MPTDPTGLTPEIVVHRMIERISSHPPGFCAGCAICVERSRLLELAEIGLRVKGVGDGIDLWRNDGIWFISDSRDVQVADAGLLAALRSMQPMLNPEGG